MIYPPIFMFVLIKDATLCFYFSSRHWEHVAWQGSQSNYMCMTRTVVTKTVYNYMYDKQVTRDCGEQNCL
jgi:hypothetical protein